MIMKKVIMEEIRKVAYEVLDISQKIYQLQEKFNQAAIFGDKVFIVGTEEDRDSISIERKNEKQDNYYYFTSPKIEGVIIKKNDSNYCIKAMVNYINRSNQNLWFAKIRIESGKEDIQLKAKWGGSWEDEDFYDEDQIINPNQDFSIAIVSMKEHLVDIYMKLCKNNGLNSNLCDPEWVKKLKKYNN